MEALSLCVWVSGAESAYTAGSRLEDLVADCSDMTLAVSRGQGDPEPGGILLIFPQEGWLGAGSDSDRETLLDGIRKSAESESHVIVFNMWTASPDGVGEEHRVMGLPETRMEQAKALNLALLRLSAETGMSVVDCDRVLGTRGVAHLVDELGSLSACGAKYLWHEACRVMAERGVFDSCRYMQLSVPTEFRKVETLVVREWYVEPGAVVESGDKLVRLEVQTMSSVRRLHDPETVAKFGADELPAPKVRATSKGSHGTLEVRANERGVFREILADVDEVCVKGDILAVLSELEESVLPEDRRSSAYRPFRVAAKLGATTEKSSLSTYLRLRRRWGKRVRYLLGRISHQLLRLKALKVRRYAHKDSIVFWPAKETDARTGIFLRGGCDLSAIYSVVPELHKGIGGRCAILREGVNAADSRTDLMLQLIDGVPDGQEELIEALRLDAGYFKSQMQGKDFTVPGPFSKETFPKSAMILSGAADLIRRESSQT